MLEDNCLFLIKVSHFHYNNDWNFVKILVKLKLLKIESSFLNFSEFCEMSHSRLWWMRYYNCNTLWAYAWSSSISVEACRKRFCIRSWISSSHFKNRILIFNNAVHIRYCNLKFTWKNPESTFQLGFQEWYKELAYSENCEFVQQTARDAFPDKSTKLILRCNRSGIAKLIFQN